MLTNGKTMMMMMMIMIMMMKKRNTQLLRYVTDLYINGAHHTSSSNYLLASTFSLLIQPFGQVLGDHTGLQQNHIWTEDELKEKLTTLYHHRPQTTADHAAHSVVSILSELYERIEE